MVIAGNDLEMYMVVPPSPAIDRSKKFLNALFWALVGLGFAHLGYRDFWGFLLDILFALLGYVTFKRLQLSSLAFFSFLCAFNAGVDMIASINLISALAAPDSETAEALASALHLEPWQMTLATVVVTCDAIVMSTCLVITCKVYSDMRALVYAQMGAVLAQPLITQQNHNPPPQTFVPFQGTPHRIAPPPAE